MDYFVTHGQGLDPFVRRELSGKYPHINLDDMNIQISDSHKFPGKIIFSMKPKEISSGIASYSNRNSFSTKNITNLAHVTDLLIDNLKTVERLFGLLFCDSDVSELRDVGVAALPELYAFFAEKVPAFAGLLEDWAEYLDANKSRNQTDEDTEDGSEVDAKRQKQSYSFRVNVKISGKFRALNHVAVTKCIASALIKNLSGSGDWFINLKKPTVEISVYLTDDGVICGVPVCQLPLSERAYLSTIPLRSTVAYCMASLAIEGEGTEPGTLIALDPMCGSGTILVELVKNFPQVLFTVGVDIDGKQGVEAFNNARKARELSKIMVLVSDSRRTLPFRRNIVFDSVVCDLPFGIQHLSKDEVTALLPKVLKNIHGGVKVGGNIVLLMSLEMSFVSEGILKELGLGWEVVREYHVKLGELPAIIYHYRKTDPGGGESLVSIV